MNVVGVVVLIVCLLPEDEEEVDQRHCGDCGELATVSDGMSCSRAKGPTN